MLETPSSRFPIIIKDQSLDVYVIFSQEFYCFQPKQILILSLLCAKGLGFLVPWKPAEDFKSFSGRVACLWEPFGELEENEGRGPVTITSHDNSYLHIQSFHWNLLYSLTWVLNFNIFIS